MATDPAMFLFEVVIEDVESYIPDCRQFKIRSEFGEIFSLDLKDPKQMNIVIPEPPPPPPEPPGKKKKKKAKPKKKKKGKKGAKEPPPPPEPIIQSGQSVLFTSTAEFLMQTMSKFPLEVSFWSKDEEFEHIGCSKIPWHQEYLSYLDNICKCQIPPPVSQRDHYNIFEENTSKLMAKVGIQIKLTYLAAKASASFRTLSEDTTARKYLYTGLNNKKSSYMCTLKTSDEWFEEHCPKSLSRYTKPEPPKVPAKVYYADFKNAPGAYPPLNTGQDSCCINRATGPPDSLYKAPKIYPSIDNIIDYVRKIIVSCNDNMRMLTPRPTIAPRVKATDIDRFCYCKEATWPMGELADRFRREVQSGPCPLCIHAPRKEGLNTQFNIANIRGPCGKPDCRIARDLRAYIQKLIEEDNTEIDLDAIIGPCGSKTCLLAEKIQEFLRHEGAFSTGGEIKEGLGTQCACIQKMQMELLKEKPECQSYCGKECEDNTDDSEEQCEGPVCPFTPKEETDENKKDDEKDQHKCDQPEQVFLVYYCTVEHNDDKSPANTGPSTPSTHSAARSLSGASASPTSKSEKNVTFPTKPEPFKHCADICPEAIKGPCNEERCGADIVNIIPVDHSMDFKDIKCDVLSCPKKDFDVSPNDSDVEIKLDDIHPYCCVKSCTIADDVKDFIVDGVLQAKKRSVEPSCFCDCSCSMKIHRKTTYCAICGGYECLGTDMLDQPSFAVPYPCPVYHKLYDRNLIKTNSPWPNEAKTPMDTISVKSSKSGRGKRSIRGPAPIKASSDDKKIEKLIQKASPKAKRKKKRKVDAEDEGNEQLPRPRHNCLKLPTRRQVPKNMGWLWDSDSIPGLKARPLWRPGAVSRLLLRRYRALREGLDSLAKKKRLLAMKKKKVEFKPTLTVKKLNGEYNVQMEVFKKYSKERLPYQYPYDDSPPLIYTIGRTEEENRIRTIKKERKERRENRRKSKLIQSTFRDRCQEICLKAYNQAMGVLPLPNPNNPDCPCKTYDKNMTPTIDSCSCSDDASIVTSETDEDEWTIEFSPPCARYDAKAKHPPQLADGDTQYTYLDYKVKLIDKQGNVVPRFFKGPDGKEVCSDLGGFWGPGHIWQEIGKDGYVGADGRWVPMSFLGPDGVLYSAEDGVFTDSNGEVMKIGVDGYIDEDNKWVYYQRKPKLQPKIETIKKAPQQTRQSGPPQTKTDTGRGKFTDTKSLAGGTKGQTTNKQTSFHQAKKVSVASKQDANVRFAGTGRAPMVMRMETNKSYGFPRGGMQNSTVLNMNQKRLSKCCDVTDDYGMFGGVCVGKVTNKTNRACNTTYRKNLSMYTMNKQCSRWQGMPRGSEGSATYNCCSSSLVDNAYMEIAGR